MLNGCIRSLARLGIEYSIAQGYKSGVLSTKKYKIDSVFTVAIDVVDGVTFYYIDNGLVLPGFGLVDASFVIKDDPEKLEIVYFSVLDFNIFIDKL